MSTLKFFKQNAGTWKTLITIYDPTGYKLYTGRSTVHIHTDKELSDNSDESCKMMVQKMASSVIKVLSDQSGKNQVILRYYVTKKMHSCHDLFWHCNACNHVSVHYRYADLHIQEQIWLVNSNLRLSISTIQKHNKCLCVSFSSDIKIA